jgi:chemotaxis signal transduction protein
MIQEYCRLKISSLLRIAIPVLYVDEVVQLAPQDISPIAGVDPCLLGLTNQRGSLLWVLHLEKFFGLKPTPLAKPIVAIALHTQGQSGEIRRVACVVMALEEIVTLDSQKLLPLPDKLPTRAKSLLSGVVKLDKNTYGVLNVNGLFQILNPDTNLDIGGNEAIAVLAGISTA